MCKSFHELLDPLDRSISTQLKLFMSTGLKKFRFTVYRQLRSVSGAALQLPGRLAPVILKSKASGMIWIVRILPLNMGSRTMQIGKTEWSVDADTPTLEAAQNTYMFALTDGRFLSLLLHRGKTSLTALSTSDVHASLLAISELLWPI